MWAHPRVIESLKDKVVIFKRGVSSVITAYCKLHLLMLPQQILPHIVEWTTFGLCSLLRQIWSTYRELREEPDPKPVPHHWVELIAALERALNYAHTGNTKVVTKALMNPLWLAPALIRDGLPSLSSVVCNLGCWDRSIDIHIPSWPSAERTSRPHLASRRSFLYNYDEDQLTVRTSIISCLLFPDRRSL